MNLFIPIIQGTTRENRRSIFVSKLVEQILNTNSEIDTKLVDPLKYKIKHDGNDVSNKIPEYTEITSNADGFIIVVPEYNHSFPGSLKSLLDTELQNYIHKPVAMIGVSKGPWGGTRAIESLVNVVRELGLICTFTDTNFTFVQDRFDENGNLKNDEESQKFIGRIEKTVDELVWMSKALKWGRENLD